MQEQIRAQLKEAMLAKDSVRVGVLRGLIAAMTNELVAKGMKPTEALSDQDVLAVIKRQVKQRKDSIALFVQGGREDLAESEKAELALLEVYLPALMPRDEIKKVVEAKIAEQGPVDKAKSGMFVGSIMKELKDKADGALVKAVVDELLAN